MSAIYNGDTVKYDSLVVCKTVCYPQNSDHFKKGSERSRNLFIPLLNPINFIPAVLKKTSHIRAFDPLFRLIADRIDLLGTIIQEFKDRPYMLLAEKGVIDPIAKQSAQRKSSILNCLL